jgi:uncharacterized membrane protein
MKGIKIGSIAMGLIIGIIVVHNMEMSVFLMQKAHEYTWAHLLIVLIFLFNLLSIIGLVLTKPWGYYVAYIAVVFSTIFFATNYIPYIKLAFHPNNHIHLLFICNGVFILIIATLHSLSIINRKTKLTRRN